MKQWILAFIIVISALLQATVLNCVNIFNVKPDLLLICMVISSISFAPRSAISLSIFSGLLKDIFSASTFGMYTFLFLLWSFLIIKLSRKITFDSHYIQLAIIFIIAVFNNIIIRLIFLFLGNFISWGIFLRITLIESLYTLLTALLILKFTRTFLINDIVKH